MTNELNGQQPRPVAAGELRQLFQPKLLPRLRETLRLRRYSLKREKVYLWAWQFVSPSPTPYDARERPLENRRELPECGGSPPPNLMLRHRQCRFPLLCGRRYPWTQRPVEPRGRRSDIRARFHLACTILRVMQLQEHNNHSIGSA